MNSEPEFRCGDPESFPGRGGSDFTFHFFFEVSNEEIMGKEQKEEVLW